NIASTAEDCLKEFDSYQEIIKTTNNYIYTLGGVLAPQKKEFFGKLPLQLKCCLAERKLTNIAGVLLLIQEKYMNRAFSFEKEKEILEIIKQCFVEKRQPVGFIDSCLGKKPLLLRSINLQKLSTLMSNSKYFESLAKKLKEDESSEILKMFWRGEGWSKF
ncbi:unnamed protein product, partial [marine sediment metagenome]